jgi:hypothetical protein
MGVNITGVNGNISLIKQTYKKFLALGEGITGADFQMLIHHPAAVPLSFLVQATQLPPVERENIETKGPHGITFNQQGHFKNAGEITLSFKEVVNGLAYAAVRHLVRNKIYFNVTMGLITESRGASLAACTLTLEDCWLKLDAADLSVEDGATLLKPAGTLYYNWPTWLDEAGEVLKW